MINYFNFFFNIINFISANNSKILLEYVMEATPRGHLQVFQVAGNLKIDK